MSSTDLKQVTSLFSGQFCTDPSAMQDRLRNARAYFFDWDGVFNNGAKGEDGSSPFSEIDSMGINMLRFNHFLRSQSNPVTAIITGEKNNAAYMFARREHFHGVCYNIKNKKEALDTLCDEYGITPQEVVYFFDDVLDLSIAEVCGLRMMVGRASSPMLQQLAKNYRLADYITASGSNDNPVREAVELLMGLAGNFDDTIIQRLRYSDNYKTYINLRNSITPWFYTSVESEIVKQVTP